MAYCVQCGAEVAAGTAYCPKCGRPQSGAAAGGSGTPSSVPVQSGLQENVAGLLCYVLGWITGLIFFFVDKRPLVRFHAAQSIVVFGTLHVILLFLGQMFVFGLFYGNWTGLSTGGMLFWLLRLASFVLWIVLMIKAYQGERFKLPIAGDFAEKLAGK
jgi:uncharacterized membrane protein